MAKVILLCGKICCGKSSYAGRIRKENCAAVLSVDEIMLAVFGQDAGEKHDAYAASLKKYLFAKSVELAEAGISAIMDLGLWTREERREARDFYHSRNIVCEIHYLDISDAEWKKRIEKRNKEVSEKKISAYYVDAGLVKKVHELFEKPDKAEIDVWVKC